MMIIVRWHKICCSLRRKGARVQCIHVDYCVYTVCTLSPKVYQSLIWQKEKQLPLSIIGVLEFYMLFLFGYNIEVHILPNGKIISS